MVRQLPYRWPAALVAGLLTLPLLGQETPLRQKIDAEIRTALAREKITPSPQADDAELLRRLYLDLVGTIPTYAEATAYLNDSDPNRRTRLIEKLLADPRFAAQQAHVWDLVLFGRRPGNIDATRKRDGFKAWLADQFAKGVPYDRWVRELIRAEQEGSELFQVQFRNQPEEATVAMTRIFLGTQLQCARCHDHPYEKWTQKDFYGMAGFLVRTVVVEKGTGATKKYQIGEKSSGEVLFTGKASEQTPGKKGEPVKPKFLGGDLLKEPEGPKDFKEPTLKTGELPPKPAFSRREKLADWITAKDNPWFARAVVNRVWGQLMGRGFIDPVDDLAEVNEPTHPALFESLTAGLLAQKFDLKWLIREIVSSEAYQRSNRGPGQEAAPVWYERARVRPLSAEELLASLKTLSSFTAEQLPSSMGEYMLRYFGEPTNGLGEFQGSLGEHLFWNNAAQIKQLIAARKGNLADELANAKTPLEDRIERLFLTVLTRKPSAKERELLTRHFATPGVKIEALVEEAVWALINTPEFRFNH